MRFGFFTTLFLSAVALVQAAPSPSPAEVEQRDLLDNLESAAAQLFSVTIDLKSILAVATPVVGSVFAEATAVVGNLLDSDPALKQEATSVLSEAESAIGPESTALGKGLDDVKNVISTPNGAVSRQDVAAARPLYMGGAAVLGSMLLGAYAAV